MFTDVGPGPKTISSTLRGLRNLTHAGRDALSFITQVQAESGDVAWFPLGRVQAVLLNRPELAHAVLVENDRAFHKLQYLRIFFRPVLGNGLLTSEGDLHRRQRKLMAPAFNHARIASYATVMTEYADDWHRTWEEGRLVDMHAEMNALTLCIVGKILFDTDLRHDTGIVRQSLTEVIDLADRRANAVIPIPNSWPTPANQRFAQALANLDRVVYRIIAERRAERRDHGDFLSTLLAAQDEDDGSVMTDLQVRDETMTLFLAGHETTANALTWTWYLLSQHPAIYARMQAELDTVLAGRTPSLTDLPHLPYTLQVFKEALRLYPPAWFLGRTALHDIDIDGIHIPARTEVMFCPWLMHRRPEVFSQPDVFDPERFTPAAEARYPKYAYMPFGGGPRVCIGNHFAMMEGHLILATLGQHLHFRRTSDAPLGATGMVTLRPTTPLHVRVHRRPVRSVSEPADMDAVHRDGSSSTKTAPRPMPSLCPVNLPPIC